MKIKNETIISEELDLAILKYKNKLLNLPQLSFSNKLCNFKLHTDINKEKIDAKLFNDSRKVNISDILDEPSHGSRMSAEKNISNFQEKKSKTIKPESIGFYKLADAYFNFSVFKNTTEEINNFNMHFKDQNISFKEEVCLSCLNTTSTIQAINEEIKLIDSDIRSLNGTSMMRQEYILKFSEYVNKINQIKIHLFKLRFLPFLQKELNCTVDNIQISFKKASQLIEVIQDSIRKHNLNVNFIVLS
jgi:hypothetical protein